MRQTPKGTEALAESSIQISRGPKGSPYHARNDYFAYATEELNFFDLNKDNIVDIRELTQSFGGDASAAQHYMSVLDQDGQAGLSAVDIAAHLYLQDGIGNFSEGTAAAGIAAASQQAYQARQAQKGQQALPMQGDGHVSVAENDAVLRLMHENPQLAQMMLQSVQKKLNLGQKYNEFLRQGGGAVPQPGQPQPGAPAPRAYVEKPGDRYFKEAEAGIQQYAPGKDGVTAADLARVMGNNQTAVRNYMHALDQDNNGELSVEELATYNYVRDAALGQIDGNITQQEQDMVNRAIMTAPQLARKAFENVMQQSQVRSQYQDYLARSRGQQQVAQAPTQQGAWTLRQPQPGGQVAQRAPRTVPMPQQAPAGQVAQQQAPVQRAPIQQPAAQTAAAPAENKTAAAPADKKTEYGVLDKKTGVGWV